jgi:hypothetical protein
MVSMVVLAGYALMFSTAGVDTVRAIPVARIGAESTGTDGFLFGEVSGMALDVRDPRTGLPSRFDRYIDGPAMLAYRIKLPTVLDSADRIHWPNPWTPRGRATRMEYLRYDSSGKPLSALGAPTYSTAAPSTAWVRTGAGGGRTVEGLNTVPFAAQPCTQ